MSEIAPDVLSRLRAFASEAPESADELNDAMRCVLSVCPDFKITGTGIDRRATFTLRDGVAKELAGRTHADLLAQAAALITGKALDRVDRRKGHE